MHDETKTKKQFGLTPNCFNVEGQLCVCMILRKLPRAKADFLTKFIFSNDYFKISAHYFELHLPESGAAFLITV